jgi:4-hydroxybenzoate polyprenyltransferase
LAFCIDNQKSPASVKEDQINKPWRPIPANLLRSQDAEWLTPIAYSTALMIGASLGGFKQSVVLALAGYCYNNLGGSEKVVERNLLNVLGILCYNKGAVTVANKGLNFTFTENYPLWIAIVAAIIFSTVQIQDFRDQEGDSIRGRKTFPLILGDQFTRYITSAAVVCWSLIAPGFLDVRTLSFLPSILLGGYISQKLLVDKSNRSDNAVGKLWSYWMIVIYSLPFMKTIIRYPIQLQ